MQRAKAFLYVSVGVFLLALAYNLGARSAGAQAPGNAVVGAGSGLVLTANGDVYMPANAVDPIYSHWTRMGNVFAGGPVPVQSQTWGATKVRYRQQATTPAGSDR